MTDTRAEFESLFWTLLAPITIVVFVAIVLLLAFTVVRGRRGGREGRSGAPRLELAYAALLAVAVAVILGFSLGAESRVDPVTEKPGVRIDVTAFQWQWRFAYPGTEVSLVGSADRPARLGARIDVVITTSSFARWLPISPRLPTPP